MTDNLSDAYITDSWIKRYDAAVAHTFGPPRLVLERASGTHVWDVDGRQYTDFLSGIAVNVLGHCHPQVAADVATQLDRLDHISNFYTSPMQIYLAESLIYMATVNAPETPAKVFLANSGTEANEAGFKLTRLTGRTKIVAMDGSFHGRTMGALAITSKKAYREPFEPLPGEVVFVPFGSVDALTEAVDDTVAAVVVESIQGENGVVPAPAGYLAAIRRVTAAHDALMWVDEVQTGIGRCGEWLTSIADGLTPDIITIAKGLGNGFPIGACIALGPAADLFTPGSHGSTFGGNPVGAAAAMSVLSILNSQKLLTRCRQLGDHLVQAVTDLDNPLIATVRGRGLLRGIVLTKPIASEVNDALLKAGWLVNAPRPNVLRVAPPLIVEPTELDGFAAALGSVLQKVEV